MNVYLIRHGKTEWNKAKRFQGQKNSPLIEEGKKQVRELGRKLKDHDFAHCYCSPLGRTRETAGLLNLKKEFIHEDSFKEIDLGVLEGETFDKIEPHLMEIIDSFWKAPHLFEGKLTGGEDFQEVQKRSVGRLEELIKEHGEEDQILIVSHGALIKGVINHYLNKPLNEYWAPPFPKPASLAILTFKGGRFTEVEYH